MGFFSKLGGITSAPKKFWFAAVKPDFHCGGSNHELYMVPCVGTSVEKKFLKRRFLAPLGTVCPKSGSVGF